MWLMARRKIEHWIIWIVGDIISIPLYIYKGLALTSIQYLIFTLIAIFGYIQWKKSTTTRNRLSKNSLIWTRVYWENNSCYRVGKKI